jgi:FlaA1/EpsC-like NDP-sugar epimerase
MKEITKPTHHEKIMIANVREYEYSEVAQQIDNLIKVSYEFDEMSIVKMMKEIVPEFRSINSPFEELDN